MTETLDFPTIGKQLEERATEVLAIAKRQDLTIVTAESCTAGLLVAVLSDAPGAAEHLHGGFVVYTEEAKRNVLGVPVESWSATASSAKR